MLLLPKLAELSSDSSSQASEGPAGGKRLTERAGMASLPPTAPPSIGSALCSRILCSPSMLSGGLLQFYTVPFIHQEFHGLESELCLSGPFHSSLHLPGITSLGPLKIRRRIP